jgi:hypothetical protein
LENLDDDDDDDGDGGDDGEDVMITSVGLGKIL